MPKVTFERVVICPNRRDVDAPCQMNGDGCAECPLFHATGKAERLHLWILQRETLTSYWLNEQYTLSISTIAGYRNWLTGLLLKDAKAGLQ